jgi:hypothetical protein
MATKFGSFTKRQVQRMRGVMGAKLRQEMGLTTRTAKRPKDKPGELADRAQRGFNRRMKEASNAKTPAARAAAREKARKALERYHESTVKAGTESKRFSGRVDAVTGVVGPRDFTEAGITMTGGRGGQGGRNLKALNEKFGSNWTTRSGMRRYQTDAKNASTRHTTMKRNYARMYRQLTGKGGRVHQLTPPKATDL